MNKVYSIVITGGPCAGKTDALGILKDTFQQKGYTVIPVAETATELIGSGIAPWTMPTTDDYQFLQIQMQYHKECVYREACRKLLSDHPILLIFDRGIIDSRVYMSDEAFQSALTLIGHTYDELLTSYDGVFHLSSAANGALSAYTLSNNAARTEKPEEAKRLDDKLVEAWKSHPQYHAIPSSEYFEDKMKRLTDAVSGLLKCLS